MATRKQRAQFRGCRSAGKKSSGQEQCKVPNIFFALDSLWGAGKQESRELEVQKCFCECKWRLFQRAKKSEINRLLLQCF